MKLKDKFQADSRVVWLRWLIQHLQSSFSQEANLAKFVSQKVFFAL